jgi:hypothetical protein
MDRRPRFTYDPGVPPGLARILYELIRTILAHDSSEFRKKGEIRRFTITWD